MPFLRMPSTSNAEMMISRCAGCGSFVGASRSKRVLSMVEAVHRCPRKTGRKPVAADKRAPEAPQNSNAKPPNPKMREPQSVAQRMNKP